MFVRISSKSSGGRWLRLMLALFGEVSPGNCQSYLLTRVQIRRLCATADRCYEHRLDARLGIGLGGAALTTQRYLLYLATLLPHSLFFRFLVLV